MFEHKTIFKSTSIISFFTVLSRITGFLRDVLLANLFGTGALAQAFFVAFKIPNVFRDLIGEGAGNAAFVPVFCEHHANRPKADFPRLVNSLLVLLLAVSALISLLGILFASGIVRLIAPGFTADAAKFQLAVSMTRLLFPYLILISLSAYLMSIANSLKSFAVPAASSAIFNLVLIFGLVLMGRRSPVSIYLLAAIVLIAGVVQIACQLPSLFKTGLDLRQGVYPRLFAQEPIRKVGRLLFPRLAGTSIYQLNVFVDTIFASWGSLVGDGAIAAIYYANRVIQFPFAIFGVAIANAALPAMAQDSARQDMARLRQTMAFSFKMVFLGLIPITLCILAFSRPLVSVIFQRGSFNAYSTDMTAQAVFFYALGLVFHVSSRFLAHVFYALQDTATPVKISAVALFLNLALNSLFIFVFRWGIAGLGLASSVSASLNFFLLYRPLKRRTGFVLNSAYGPVFKGAFLASLSMLALIYPVWHYWAGLRPNILGMFLTAGLGTAAYVLFLWWLGVKEVKEFAGWLWKKRYIVCGSG